MITRFLLQFPFDPLKLLKYFFKIMTVVTGHIEQMKDTQMVLKTGQYARMDCPRKD